MLSVCQRQALLRYFQLMSEAPSLFEARYYRKLILDRVALEHFAAENDVIIGVVAETPYCFFIVDVVESGNQADIVRFPYQRVVYKAQLRGGTNVVVVGKISAVGFAELGRIALVRQERHATGLSHLELPRGFGEVGLSGVENALNELRSETGLVGREAFFIGSTFTDTGLTDARVDFFQVSVVGQTERDPENSEAIQRVELLTEMEIAAAVRAGDIRDAFTVQAVTFMKIGSL